jgi:nitrogen fixation NifU-like protein
MSDMYTERLLDHARHPRRKGLLAAGPGQILTAEEYNPLCGDRVTFQVRLLEGRLAEARFDGRGCALCLGAASILAEVVEGRPLDELQAMDQGAFLPELQSEVRPARLRCALLPWVAFRRAAFGEEEA